MLKKEYIFDRLSECVPMEQNIVDCKRDLMHGIDEYVKHVKDECKKFKISLFFSDLKEIEESEKLKKDICFFEQEDVGLKRLHRIHLLEKVIRWNFENMDEKSASFEQILKKLDCNRSL